MQDYENNIAENGRSVIVVKSEKSLGVGLILAFLFGPLATIYVTPLLGLLFTIVAIIFVFISLGLGILITWPASILWVLIATPLVNAASKKRLTAN